MSVMMAASLTATATQTAGAAVAPGGTFTDDDGNTHEGSIEAIAIEGITKGCNPPFNDHYCPTDPVSRGEMAAFIRRALQLPDTSTDHFTDDDHSTFENDINAIAQAGITKGCNPPSNDHYCPIDPVSRDEMASFLARMLGLTATKPPPRPALDWELVADGLDRPVEVLTPPGEDRMLVAEQPGLVRAIDGGSISTFLDLTGDVVFGGERGLLSIALHPDYPEDRRLFAWYFASGSRTLLVEYDIAADLETASSPRTILSVRQPANNHNGGFITFGDDGFLYLSLGDGGGGNDTFQNARDLNTLLGKIIRIDVDGDQPYEIPPDNPYVGRSGRDEIWASGLRNPWRWSFDDGRMYIGDVGQGTREEIDVVDVAPVGYDFGWSRFEGNVCNPNDHDPSCSTAGLTFPVVDYGRSVGQIVTGGIVYRGPAIRSLSGFYLYADVNSGLVGAFRMKGGDPVDNQTMPDLDMSGIVSFGKDADDELLVVNLFQGAIYRMTGG
jgi:glucose/arabinose dehydrogenase